MLGEFFAAPPADPQVPSGEAGLLTVPARMRDALAACERDASRVAAKWQATDELSGWPPDEVLRVVEELVTLARRAVDGSHQIYFWWSL